MAIVSHWQLAFSCQNVSCHEHLITPASFYSCNLNNIIIASPFDLLVDPGCIKFHCKRLWQVPQYLFWFQLNWTLPSYLLDWNDTNYLRGFNVHARMKDSSFGIIDAMSSLLIFVQLQQVCIIGLKHNIIILVYLIMIFSYYSLEYSNDFHTTTTTYIKPLLSLTSAWDYTAVLLWGIPWMNKLPYSGEFLRNQVFSLFFLLL